MGGFRSPSFLFKIMEQNGAKIVSSAIVGMDFKVIIVNSRSYIISPPTIKKMAGAFNYLADAIGNGNSIRELFLSASNVEPLAHALSWFIQGNDCLFEELSNGTRDEIIDGLDAAYSLISTKSFLKLSDLTKNVANLIARPK